ncbi:MAG: polymer-forming cytoskeletal protein [Candidatus Omnitrophica bacterium]|nr:polymer-forming cytoskeletal protein [Candidatus Omnitrophota bacterium]
MLKRKKDERGSEQLEATNQEKKILDVNASMTGTLTFKDPVNLRIDGQFEGVLDTKGTLTIGQNAVINANITGETIIIAGRVTGDIIARNSLELIPPAVVSGNIDAPSLAITAGAILDGRVHMHATGQPQGQPAVANGGRGELSLQEVATYLEVEARVVEDWARQGKIPARRRGEEWVFDQARIDRWIADEKVNI